MPDNNNINTKKNINKDCLVEINARTATLTAGNLTFYITDKNTSNIFFKLTFRNPEDNPNSLLINNYVPEESEEYDLILRIIKPNNEPVEMTLEPLDYKNNYYYIDLPDRYKDLIGPYICEVFIDTYINKDGIVQLERRTTNSFTYTVVGSIMNNLDEEIKADPNYPLVDSMLAEFRETLDETIREFRELDYATREYVDTSIEQFVETLVVNNPVDGVINLIPNKRQIATIKENVILALPEVDKYTEIYLYFTPTVAFNVIPPVIKYRNLPAIEVGKTYEFIFTYIGEWIAGVVVYE